MVVPLLIHWYTITGIPSNPSIDHSDLASGASVPSRPMPMAEGNLREHSKMPRLQLSIMRFLRSSHPEFWQNPLDRRFDRALHLGSSNCLKIQWLRDIPRLVI